MRIDINKLNKEGYFGEKPTGGKISNLRYKPGRKRFI